MVEYIIYKKKKHPVRVSYFALKHMSKETGSDWDLSNIGGMDIEMYESLLFYSLQSGAKATGIKFEFKKEDMEDVLDECLFQFVEVLPKFFPKAMAGEGVKNNKKMK